MHSSPVVTAVGRETAGLQLLQPMPRLLWFVAVLIHIDDHEGSGGIGQEASELHLVLQVQRLLWHRAFLARADGNAGGGHGGQETSELQVRLRWLFGLSPTR